MNTAQTRAMKAKAQAEKPKIYKLDGDSGSMKPIKIKENTQSISKPSAPTKVNSRIDSGVSKKYPELNRHPKPVKIGYTLNSSQWRCGICTFLNSEPDSVCKTCESKKGETRRGAPIITKPPISNVSNNVGVRRPLPKKF